MAPQASPSPALEAQDPLGSLRGEPGMGTSPFPRLLSTHQVGCTAEDLIESWISHGYSIGIGGCE